MSYDTVDDLHMAEDFAGSCVALIEKALDSFLFDTPLEAEARGRVEQWKSYCRPTCGAEGDQESDECDDDTCGCPCGHTGS